MSISSFNLSRSKSRKTRGSQYPRHDRFHRTVPDFDNDWQALRSPTRSHSGIKIRANNRLHSHSRSKIGDRRSWRDEHGERECERARSSGTKSHSHSVELDAINVIININNVIGHKKKPRSGNETIPPLQCSTLQLSHSSPACSCKHRRTNCTQSNFWLFWFGGASDAATLRAPRSPIDKAQEQIPATTQTHAHTHTHTTSIYSGPGTRGL